MEQSTEQLHLLVECLLLIKAEFDGFVAAEGLDQLDFSGWKIPSEGTATGQKLTSSLRNSAPTALSFLSIEAIFHQ